MKFAGALHAPPRGLSQPSWTFYFFWTWHRGTPSTQHRLNLVRFPLTPEAMQRKEAALRCHRSQLQHAGGHPILPENLLQPMQRPFEIYLPA